MKKGAIQRKMEVVGVSRDYLIEERNEEDTHCFQFYLCFIINDAMVNYDMNNSFNIMLHLIN